MTQINKLQEQLDQAVDALETFLMAEGYFVQPICSQYFAKKKGLQILIKIRKGQRPTYVKGRV